MNDTPPLRPVRDKRLSASKVVGTILGTQVGTFETEMKTANYEAMMHRFQLRRMSSQTPSSRKLNAATSSADRYLQSSLGKHHGLQRFSFRRITRRLSREVLRASEGSCLILPWSNVATMHGLLMLILYHFQVFYLPFAPVFVPSGSAWTTIINVILEVIFLLHIAFTFNTAYVDNKVIVVSRRQIAHHYAHHWLVVDVLSSIPVQIIRQVLQLRNSENSLPHPILLHDSLLIALRIIRFTFAGRIFLRRTIGANSRLAALINYSRYSHLLGILKLLWLVLVIAHYMACSWHLLDVNMPHPDQSIADKYIANYFYAVSLIHGQGNISDHWGQNLLATSIILIGSVIVATVFGNVAMLVSNFNANATNYQRKMESVFATMDKMELPDRLRDRIQQYYAHIWAEYKSLDGDLVKFQRELTHTLGLEVGLYKYMSLVNDIPFWIDCSPDFIAQIVLTLVVRVYLPDDYVVRQGEICDEMFMINRGVCERSKSKMYNTREDQRDTQEPEGCKVSDREHIDNAVNSNPRVAHFQRRHGLSTRSLMDSNAIKVYSTRARTHLVTGLESSKVSTRSANSLHRGEAFGEMSLLMNYEQPNNIRATTFVETCVLQRATFQRIISRYPRDRRRVLKSILKISIEKKDTPFPWEAALYKVNALRKRQQGSAGLSPWNDVSPTEAANLLAEYIDIELPDASIRFGFQSLDKLIPDPVLVKPRETTIAQPESINSNKRDVMDEPVVPLNSSETNNSNSGELSEVITMLRDLSETVRQINDDVKILKLQQAYRSTRCDSCSRNLSAEHNDDHPIRIIDRESQIDVSPLSARTLHRDSSKNNGLPVMIGWTHRGSSRRIETKPIHPQEDLLSAFEEQTPTLSSTSSSTESSMPPQPNLPEMHKPPDLVEGQQEDLGANSTKSPNRKSHGLRFFSFQHSRDSSPQPDLAFERRSTVGIASSPALRIGEPNSRLASATALADQLWNRR